MIRKLAPVAVVAALALAACGGQGGRIADPREILEQSVEAMADIDSVHFVLALDGEVNLAETGGNMSLNGTELEGSIDMDGTAAQLSFAVPAFLGVTGEMRLVDGQSFLKTSMTGPLWVRSEVSEDGDDPLAQAADPQQALEELNEFLARDGVDLEKLDDTSCGDDTCYQLRLDIAGSVFTEEAGADIEELGAIAEEGISLMLLVDTETLHWRGVSTSFEDPEMGSLSLSLTFDGYGDPVDVEAPPEDEVTDDPGSVPFP